MYYYITSFYTRQQKPGNHGEKPVGYEKNPYPEKETDTAWWLCWHILYQKMHDALLLEYANMKISRKYEHFLVTKDDILYK